VSHTPEELERLMWSVAESEDPNAINEFGDRFPHLRTELVKRMSMVRQLRGAAKPGTPVRQIPKFENRPVRPAPVQPSVWIGSGLVLAAVAAAAFVVTRSLTRPPVIPEAPFSVKIDAPPLPDPGIKYREAPPVAPAPAPPATKPEAVATEEHDPAQVPQTVKFDRIRLASAIKAVAASGGLELELAPNLADPYVRIEYRGYSALDILQDMGKRFGFTAFDDGPHRVLIIPARDSQTVKSGSVDPGDTPKEAGGNSRLGDGMLPNPLQSSPEGSPLGGTPSPIKGSPLKGSPPFRKPLGTSGISNSPRGPVSNSRSAGGTGQLAGKNPSSTTNSKPIQQSTGSSAG
jgi:hypothetical protein